MRVPATNEVIERVQERRARALADAIARHGGRRLRCEKADDLLIVYLGNCWGASGAERELKLAEGQGTITESKAKRLWPGIVFIWSSGRFNHPPQMFAERNGERHLLLAHAPDAPAWVRDAARYWERRVWPDFTLSDPRPA